MGPSLPHEKQYQRKENDFYRFARTDLSQHVQHAHDCRGKPVMKPCGNPLIGCPEKDSLNPVSAGMLEEKKRRLKSGRRLSRINCWIESNLVPREGSRLTAAISEDDLRKVSSIEIVLAKIVCGRYIGFTSFIRYVGVRSL